MRQTQFELTVFNTSTDLLLHTHTHYKLEKDEKKRGRR
jgi:hypothetical protein